MGPYLELATYRYPFVSSSRRLGLHGRAQAQSQSGPWAIEGFGGGGRISFSYGAFRSEATASCETQFAVQCLVGFYHGEGSIGTYIDGGVGFIRSQPVWQVTLGVEARLPAILGVLFLTLVSGSDW
jgi:hypothetical protein